MRPCLKKNCWDMVQWHSVCPNTSKAVGSNPSIDNKTVTKYFPQIIGVILGLQETEPQLSRDREAEADCERDVSYDQKCLCLRIQSLLFKWPIAMIMLLLSNLLNKTTQGS